MCELRVICANCCDTEINIPNVQSAVQMKYDNIFKKSLRTKYTFYFALLDASFPQK